MSCRVGLVGIGLMGSALAHRLSESGWQVNGWDIAEQRREQFSSNAGACLAESVEQLLQSNEMILLSLPSHETVNRLFNDNRASLKPGQTIIDTSTGDPQAAVRFANELRLHGVEYIDATISGSSVQVANDTALMLIGASEEALAVCSALLEAILSNRIHVGPVGSAAQMKLVTNLVLGLNRAALAEGLAYAEALGLSGEQTLAILRASMAYSRIMDSKGEKMIRGDFAPQAKLTQHAKDVALILADAHRLSTAFPLTQTHQEILQRAIELGWGDEDNSAIINAYRKQTRQ